MEMKMESMTDFLSKSAVAFFLLNTLIVYIGAVILCLFSKDAVMNALRRDWLGGWLIAAGLVAFGGYYLPGFYQTMCLTIGGFVFGIGVLVILNDDTTKKVLDPRVAVGVGLLVGALYVIYYNVLKSAFGELVSYIMATTAPKVHWTWMTTIVLIIALGILYLGVLLIKGARFFKRAYERNS